MNLLVLAGLGVACFVGAMYFSKNAEEKTSTVAIGAAMIALIVMAYTVARLKLAVPFILLMLVGVPLATYFAVYISMKPKIEEASPWEGKTISEMIERSKDVKRAGILIVIAALIGLMLIWRYGK